jgi:hypothetical protein
MKLKLLTPHTVPVNPRVGDQWLPAGTILDPPPPGYKVTPEMEGLDSEGREAVRQAHIQVFGRCPWPYGLYPINEAQLLDNPPIPRPLVENQPVFHYTASKEYLG